MAGSMMEARPAERSTASALATYRDELQDASFDPELIEGLVRDAARYLLDRHGLCVLVEGGQ